MSHGTPSSALGKRCQVTNYLEIGSFLTEEKSSELLCQANEKASFFTFSDNLEIQRTRLFFSIRMEKPPEISAFMLHPNSIESVFVKTHRRTVVSAS